MRWTMIYHRTTENLLWKCRSLESGPEIWPRQPESEPSSEPGDRNVRPRLAPDQEVTRLDEVENSESATQIRGDVGQTPDEVLVDNLSGAASSIHFSYPLVSASNYLTVLPLKPSLFESTGSRARECRRRD